MTTINGVAIHPGFFRARQRREELRVGTGAAPRSRVKATAVHKPSAPRARYCMPVAVVALAAGAFVGGATAFAAATTVIGMVAAGAVMVGSAMVVVGTVADKPNLVKWGGVLAAVGGLGLAAEGAGLLGSEAGAPEATSVISAGDADQALANETIASNAPISPGDAEQALASQTAASAPAVTPVATPAPVATAPAPAPQQPPGLLASQETAPPAATSGQSTSTTATASGAPSSFQTPTQTGPNAFRTGGPAPVSDATAFAPGATPGASSTTGYFDQMGRWVRNNKELAQIGAQAATGLLASAVPKPQTPEQQAQAEYLRRRAAMLDPNSSWWRQQPSGG